MKMNFWKVFRLGIVATGLAAMCFIPFENEIRAAQTELSKNPVGFSKCRQRYVRPKITLFIN
ncbi:MAG: hypothetical protein LBS83_01765 [Holosporales bacterium]|jgi:hypothetical protein|nr:hypothetical protein [Holosporales bacterium]